MDQVGRDEQLRLLRSSVSVLNVGVCKQMAVDRALYIKEDHRTP